MVQLAAFSRQLPRVRELVVPIYVERGIRPEIAVGLSDAAALRDESERQLRRPPARSAQAPVVRTTRKRALPLIMRS